MKEYKFTEEQKATIGKLMAQCWGGHMQTGFNYGTNGHPVLWVQLGPQFARTRFTIMPDGKTRERLG